MTQLCGRAYLHGCTFEQENMGSWERPVCVLTCPNKCSSQSRVLFSLQQHTTTLSFSLVECDLKTEPSKSPVFRWILIRNSEDLNNKIAMSCSPFLNRVNVLGSVNGPFEPWGPHFEVGFVVEAVEEVAQPLGKIDATRGQVCIAAKPAFDVVVWLTWKKNYFWGLIRQHS